MRPILIGVGLVVAVSAALALTLQRRRLAEQREVRRAIHTGYRNLEEVLRTMRDDCTTDAERAALDQKVHRLHP